MKKKEREIESQLNTREAKELYKVLASIDNSEEIAKFLRDLFTIAEIQEAIRRFQVAKLLSQGYTFRNISAETEMSTSTIARINYWLHHGTGGYRKALQKV